MTYRREQGALSPLLRCIWTAVVLLLAVSSEVSACPLCKEALFDPGQMHQRLATAKGYALSIALLLSVPAALVAGVTTLIVRAHRRKRHV